MRPCRQPCDTPKFWGGWWTNPKRVGFNVSCLVSWQTAYQVAVERDHGRLTSNSESISIVLSSAVRSLALDWNSKLSIRMVAGFAELIEGKRFFGCGGLQPSEFASPAVQSATDSSRGVARPLLPCGRRFGRGIYKKNIRKPTELIRRPWHEGIKSWVSCHRR